MKILWIILFVYFTVFYINTRCSAIVSYHTCKVRAGVGNIDIDDFEKRRPARSIKAECFRICYALMTKTKYYTNTCLGGTTDYVRWFKTFRCPKQIQNPILIADGIIPDDLKLKLPTNLCPGWKLPPLLA